MVHPSPKTERVVTAPRDRRDALVEVILGARRRLSLSLFRCNDDVIFEALRQAVRRGVVVDVLMTGRAKGGRKRLDTLRDALIRTGANVHEYGDPVVKYHAKYLVADDGPAVVASLNCTRKCFNKTSDCLVVTYDPDVVSGLQRLIAADRDGRPLPSGLSPRLIIGPELARRQLTTLVMQARESIQVIDAKLSDPDLVALLGTRKAEGLAVDRIDTKKVGGLKSHGKFMMIDNRTAVVGGLALTALSLEFRREVALVVESPAAVAQIARVFEQALAVGGSAPGRG